MVLNSSQVVFIVGVGRSGTTLLQSMLNAHPDVCFPPETHFFRLYIQSGKFDKLLIKNGVNGLAAHLKCDKYLKRLELDIDKLFVPFRVNKQSPSAVEFYLLLLSEYAKRFKKKIIGDKDPRSIEFLSALHRYFPNASIIHMIRDPRDVIVSRMKADWSKNRNFMHHVFTYKVQIQIGREMGERLFKGRYFELLYEQLLKDPDETLRNVCNFLSIPYSSKMLDFFDSAKEIITRSEMQWKKEALGPLLRDNWGKWKNSLKSSQILLIEQCCPEVFCGNPYSLSDIRNIVGYFERILTKIVSILLSTLATIYRQWRCR